MMIDDEDRGGVLVVRIGEKRLDASRAPLFKEEIAARIERGYSQIVLDLSSVEFIDSSGLGAIVSCLKRLGPRGNLSVAGASGAVAKLFALTRMDRVFSLHDTADAAVANVSG